MMSYLVVFLGAGVGGAMRHAMNIWIARYAGTHFPWHTLVINITGSIVMGGESFAGVICPGGFCVLGFNVR